MLVDSSWRQMTVDEGGGAVAHSHTDSSLPVPLSRTQQKISVLDDKIFTVNSYSATYKFRVCFQHTAIMYGNMLFEDIVLVHQKIKIQHNVS